jgi:CheY-like chemotaxis protein
MDGRGRLLLIVEDVMDARVALGKAFYRRGWHVCLAATVAEALDLLDQGVAPDALIVDLRLPDGGGEQVLRRVRNSGLAARLAVVTGTHDPGRLARLRLHGPDLVLFKPVDPDALGNLLDGRLRSA